MRKKSLTSVLILIIMLVSIIAPIPTYATSSDATITVQSTSDSAGSIVNIAVSIENNPGILGATLKLKFDDGLILENADNGNAFSGLSLTKPGRFTSPCNFVWDGMDLDDSDIMDGTILNLQFKIDESAQAGSKFNVSVSYEAEDIVDFNLDPVNLEIINGVISVVDYLPGDLNGDRKVNTTDIIMLRRFIAGGYDLTINESAADVNSDGKRNTTDIILMRRYVAGGYDVELRPSKELCDHIMQEVPYKAVSCEEDGHIAYWYCSKCEKYFSDANGTSVIRYEDVTIESEGHSIVIDPVVEPTYESTGLTEGKHCSVCGEVITEQQVIPALKKDEYSITYNVTNNDKYLEALNIENPNPTVYTSQDGLELEDINVNGYNFIGWYTRQSGGDLVTSIAPGTTGNKTLYAHWEKVVYNVYFYSDMVPVNDLSYTVGEERPLPKLSKDKYTFIGWSTKVTYETDEGETKQDWEIWDSIPAGTTGNITVYANWASNRNKAVPVSVLKDPLIFEDTENGQILFTYEIGEVQNVPLYTTLNLFNAGGIVTKTSVTETESISESNAKAVTHSIGQATTDSSTWTISSGWNETTNLSEKYDYMTTEQQEEVRSKTKSKNGTYTLNTSSGGMSNTVKSSNSEYKISNNQSHSDSHTSERTDSAELNVSGKVEASTKVPGAKVGIEISGSAGTSTQKKNSSTGTNGSSFTVDLSGGDSSASTSQKSWNTQSGYTSSSGTSTTDTTSKAISNTISKQYGYGKEISENGSDSHSQAFQTTKSDEQAFSNTLTYNTSKMTTTVREFETRGEVNGDYRMVMAGTVHTFAVVGYDIANCSYYVYTYNVLDDTKYEYLDYSFDGTWNDYETSIIPFEVPYFVDQYVNSRIEKTSGLEIDADTGIITSYTPVDPSNPDKVIAIPSFISVSNNDGTYSAIKVRGISSNLFRNNTMIEGVELTNYITEIPDNAFEGCTSLQYVYAPGVTSIGNSAFAGCTALDKFTLDFTDEDSTYSLGNNAFAGVEEIEVIAPNVGVAQAAVNSGANKITLDISKVKNSGMELNVDTATYFELQGKDNTFRGLSVKSNAETTIINGISFTENTKIPLDLNSDNVTLDRVSVNSTGIALVLRADNTNVTLNRTIGIASNGNNAVLTKSVALSELSNDVVGKIDVVGNWLTCGTISDDSNLLSITNGTIVNINPEDFDGYINSHRVYFNANGGYVGEGSRLVGYNTAIGNLPQASRDYFVFDGWYTESGTPVYADTIMTNLQDITLYAHWHEGAVSAWVPVQNAPADAQILNRKYTYTETYYTTSGSSSLSGWTLYNTTWAWGSWGSWSSWSDTKRTASDSRQVETKSVDDKYVYYRYAASYNASTGSKTKTSTCTTKYTYKISDTLTSNGSGGYKLYHDSNGDYDKNGSKYHSVWKDDPFRTQKTQYRYRDRSKVYTYYYQRSENKEAYSYPSGNISNVQEYVQYRAK